jgi:outer membrane protein assembly factor BamA
MANGLLKIILLLLCLSGGYFARGQRIALALHSAGDTAVAAGPVLFTIGKVPVPQLQYFDEITDVYSYLRRLVPQMQEQGYLAASVDSISQAKDTLVEAWVFRGKPYRWAQLSLAKIPVPILNDIGLRSRDWEGQPVSPRRLAALSERILVHCENNGYPFAYTAIDHIEGQEDGLKADLVLERNNLVKFDTIIIESNVEVSRDFLQNYLGIHQGDLFNESQLRLVSKRLKELAFLQESRPWQMDFTIAKNELRLFLKEKKANQLNGLIGLQPNTVETGKFMLTADILLGLKNALGYGETIAATYQNLQYKSPRFHADAMVPYLLGTPFGLEGSFDLFKRDTTFRRTSFDGGIRYQLNATDYIKVSYQAHSNRLITADTNYVRSHKKLPENLDVTAKGAAVEFLMDRTDYKLNPRKGWQARVTASGLLREVLRNDAIIAISDGSGFDYAGLYDTLNNNKYQYRITGSANYYFRLGKNAILKLGYNGGYISGASLFQNELFQLGGFKLLRGFDEQSIYASQYHIGTIELRLLLGQNSYFYIFNDDAFLHSLYQDVDRKDYPVSLGGGITLENKSGIFNIALGLGKRSGEGFQFRQTKIHFGYTAYF